MHPINKAEINTRNIIFPTTFIHPLHSGLVFLYSALQGTAQRFALPALGRGRRSRPTGKMIRRVKLLEICADSPASGARFVGRAFYGHTIGMVESGVTSYRLSTSLSSSNLNTSS